MHKAYLIFVLLLLAVPIVFAGTYTLTGRQDFNVYSDPGAEMGGKIYQTVSINNTDYPGEEFKCITMIFYRDSSNILTHVQSNPPLSSSMVVGRPDPDSPEAMGYFRVNNGLANVYYRNDNIVAYNNFTYVIKCNSNNTELVYEEAINPMYKSVGKDLPSRGVWFKENADYIVLIFAAGLLFVMFAYYKLTSM
jgi:hypothetical protein